MSGERRRARARTRASLKSAQARDMAQTFSGVDGSSLLRERTKSGRKGALLFSAVKSAGSSTYHDPAVSFAYYVRKLLRPIRTPVSRVYGPDGVTLVATISVDPVTGERTRATAGEEDA